MARPAGRPLRPAAAPPAGTRAPARDAGRLVGAEWLKVRSSYGPWWLLAGAGALSALATAVVLLGLTALAGAGTFGAAVILDSPQGIRIVVAQADAGSLLAVIVGILAFTSEHRHRTLTHTLLTTPDRRRALGAKVAAYAVVGLAFGVLECAVSLAVAVPWLSHELLATPVLSGDVGLVLGGVLLSTAAYTVIGVGLGALVANQAAAIVIALVWQLVVQGLVTLADASAGRWTPGGAVDAVLRTGSATFHPAPPWVGVLLLLAYACAFCVAGGAALARRDVG